ncbi:MAG: 50S ribosomal protein L25/general stress protein Ctc [Bacteroidales bacterium]|nr:50S ribosomal protein L25/general stress protein Ctc [Bacteroidales bacterium]
MKTVSMSGSLRENVGKKDAKKTRNSGFIPSVIYGGKEQLHIAIPVRDFRALIFSHEIAFVKIEVEGKEINAILQDIQYHPVSDNIMHADFLELIDGKEIVMGVPVTTTGIAPGILEGGKLQTKLRKLKLKALPENLPETITLDISDLNIGNSIKVKEVEVPNAVLLDAANAVVVAVKVTRAAASEGLDEEGEELEGAEGAEGEAKPEASEE